MSMNKMSKLAFLILSMFVVLCTIACSTTDAPKIAIDSPWGRPSPKVATAGAFYMVIKNTGSQADTLLSAKSTSCGTVELHESYDKGGGVMGMREVEGGVIEIPANSEVELKMGGLHIMCIDKLADFQKGAKLLVTLDFEVSGTKSVEVEIREPEM
jgi:copper(I)-binding protein